MDCSRDREGKDLLNQSLWAGLSDDFEDDHGLDPQVEGQELGLWGQTDTGLNLSSDTYILYDPSQVI